LLEAMQERQVTIGEQTFLLDDPFLVLATQNPIEQEGTYPLPEAELDRFMLKIKIDYPNEMEEQLIIRNQVKAEPLEQIRTVTTGEEIRAARKLVRQVVVDEKIEQYIIRIVFATVIPKKTGLATLRTRSVMGHHHGQAFILQWLQKQMLLWMEETMLYLTILKKFVKMYYDIA